MLYFVLPEKGTYPGIARLFSETIAVVGGKQIYLADMHQVTEEDVVMFGAWHLRYAMAIRRNCKAKRKYIHWSSPLLQAELAGVELGYLSTIVDLLNKDVIDGIWMNDKGIYDTYKDLGNIFYAPAPFDTTKLDSYRKGVEERGDVSFFSVFHNKQKNVLTQLSGAKRAQVEHPFTLYVNGLTPDQTAFVDMIGLKYCDLHYLPSSDYYEWLSMSKLCLQASVSEAFSYIAAEILSLSVPLLMSEVVARNMGVEDERLIITDISSVDEIKEGISNILCADEKPYNNMCYMSRIAVDNTATRNNKAIRDMFASLLE